MLSCLSPGPPRRESLHVDRRAPARHPRSSHPQSRLTRRAARVWDPPAHRADLARTPPSPARHALSRSLSPRGSRTPRHRVGNVREQPARQVLLAHRGGTQAAPHRTVELGTGRRRHDRRAARDAGVVMRTLISRARAIARHLLGRARFERDMDEEFRSHLQHRADDLERRGLPRDAAERAARVEFGGVEAQKDAARDARAMRWLEELRASITFAARGLGHHPIQSLIVATTLTIGIGISAVVFSTMNALAFRARVDRDAGTFTRILVSYRTDTTPPSFPGAATLGDYLAFVRSMRSLSSITGWQHVQLSLSAGARPTPGALVTCTFFDVYGPIQPIAGRMLQRDDCESRAPLAVIGSDLRQSAFGADPGAVGRVLRINGQTIRIVGIAPTFSSASTDDQIWLPYTLRESLHLGPNDAASPNAMKLFV